MIKNSCLETTIILVPDHQARKSNQFWDKRKKLKNWPKLTSNFHFSQNFDINGEKTAPSIWTEIQSLANNPLWQKSSKFPQLKKNGKNRFFGKKLAQKLPKNHGTKISIAPKIGMWSWIARSGPHAKFQNNPSGAIREKRRKTKKSVFLGKISPNFAQNPWKKCFNRSTNWHVIIDCQFRAACKISKQSIGCNPRTRQKPQFRIKAICQARPAGPLPRGQESLRIVRARPPRGAGVPPNQELPLSHSILPFVLLTSHYLLPLNVQIKKPTKTRSRRRLGEASNSSTQEIEKLFRDDACQLEPFRLGVRRNSIDGSSSIDYRRNCLAGDKPLRQFLFGLKLRK